MPQAQHPAYRGLFDYDALKARSNANYDAQDAGLREAPDYGGYNNTMSIMANQANKQSPWSPYFQSLQDQGVSKVGMDMGRPQGLASNPEWATQGDVGNLAGTGDHIARQPLMDSQNIAGPQPVGFHSQILNGLTEALPQPSRGRFGTGVKGF